jgi:carbonic anhydrase/acetyltransferase-like protein (isoleucine patch superfamily)
MSFKLISYENNVPNIHQKAYVADNCCLIGDVTIGSKSSVWFNSVLRGDVAAIKVGNNSNLQDGTIVHTSRFNGPVIIGNNVTIGHCCLIHASIINDNAFIGMRATIMDNCLIEEFGFVAAGSLLTPNKIVKSKELWIGAPAKFVRYLTDKDLEEMSATTKSYIELTTNYLKNKSIYQ